jgi:hypothetical protein
MAITTSTGNVNKSSATVNKLSGSPILARVKGLEEDWSSTLVVNEDDTFHFDHPLDHIPGMLLLSGVLELIQVAEDMDATERAAQRLSMSITFRAFAELDEPTALRAARSSFVGQGVQWSVAAEQGRSSMLDGWVNIRSGEPLEASSSATVPDSEPVAADLVHRHRPANILLGVPRAGEAARTMPLLAPPVTHPLVERSPDFRTIEELTEAARQFIISNSHTVDGLPMDTQMILSRITLDLPRALPRDVPVAMRSQRSSNNGGRRSLRFELIDERDGQSLGQFVVSGRGASPASYARLRGFAIAS